MCIKFGFWKALGDPRRSLLCGKMWRALVGPKCPDKQIRRNTIPPSLCCYSVCGNGSRLAWSRIKNGRGLTRPRCRVRLCVFWKHPLVDLVMPSPNSTTMSRLHFIFPTTTEQHPSLPTSTTLSSRHCLFREIKSVS